MIQIDMQMPKTCEECPLCHRAFDGNETRLSCYGLGAWCFEDDGRLDNCPLHEVTDSDTISRQAVIDTVRKIILGFFSEKDGAMTDTEKTLLSVNKAVCNELAQLSSAQPETHEKRTETHACDCIKRQAVERLDWFTKLYCRDKSITDDLAFRCKQCEFEMPDKTCLVKVMARKLCPDYKGFGAMGDL